MNVSAIVDAIVDALFLFSPCVLARLKAKISSRLMQAEVCVCVVLSYTRTWSLSSLFIL